MECTMTTRESVLSTINEKDSKALFRKKVTIFAVLAVLVVALVPSMAYGDFVKDFLRDAAKKEISWAFDMATQGTKDVVPESFDDLFRLGSTTVYDMTVSMASGNQTKQRTADLAARNERGIAKGVGSAVQALSSTLIILVAIMKLVKIAERVDANSSISVLREVALSLIGLVALMWLCSNSTRILSATFNSVIAITAPEEIQSVKFDFINNMDFIDSLDTGDLFSFLLLGLLLWLLSGVTGIAIRVAFWARGIQMYFYAALAPVPLAMLGIDTTRQIGIGFLKNFAALCLAYVANIFVITVWPIIATSALSAYTQDGATIGTATGAALAGSVGGAVANIGGGMVITILEVAALFVLQFIVLIKSGNWARDLLGG